MTVGGISYKSMQVCTIHVILFYILHTCHLVQRRSHRGNIHFVQVGLVPNVSICANEFIVDYSECRMASFECLQRF
jgi:hypothetical protein